MSAQVKPENALRELLEVTMSILPHVVNGSACSDEQLLSLARAQRRAELALGLPRKTLDELASIRTEILRNPPCLCGTCLFRRAESLL